MRGENNGGRDGSALTPMLGKDSDICCDILAAELIRSHAGWWIGGVWREYPLDGSLLPPRSSVFFWRRGYCHTPANSKIRQGSATQISSAYVCRQGSRNCNQKAQQGPRKLSKVPEGSRTSYTPKIFQPEGKPEVSRNCPETVQKPLKALL